VGNSPLSGSDPLGLCGDDAPDADVEAYIQQVQGAYHAFWGGVHGVGRGLQAGIEFAAAFNPTTSVGTGLNKLGEGKYVEAGLFFAPVVGALGSEGGAAVEAAEGEGVFYHGTDIQSARHLLSGGELDAGAAAARKAALNLGGDPGFYLASEYQAGEFFAVSRQPGAVLRYEIDPEALAQLRAAGATHGPIPYGGAGAPPGGQLFVPEGGFGLFNQLRAAGRIGVTAARRP